MRYGHVAIAIAAMTVTACSSSRESVGPTCTTELITAVAVDVRDATTGGHAAFGAVLLGKHTYGGDVFTDTGRVVSRDSLTIFVGALPGTYDLLLTAPGYAAWSANGIVVPSLDSQACKPNAVRVQATLQPVSLAGR